jgi:hypothetical protein
MVNDDNYLGMVLYLLKERDSKHINTIMTELINKHKSKCCQTKCKLCKLIYKKQMLTPEKLAAFLYKTYIKDRKILFNETYDPNFNSISLWCDGVARGKYNPECVGVFAITYKYYHPFYEQLVSKNS